MRIFKRNKRKKISFKHNKVDWNTAYIAVILREDIPKEKCDE